MSNGNSGNRVIDKYGNMSTLPDHLRLVKKEPWWEYAIDELSQGSLLGGDPRWAIAGMIAMSLCSTVQDSVGAYETKEADKKKQIEEARRIEEPSRQ